MSVITQFQLPIGYEQFKAFDQSINPEQVAPPGLTLHIVSQQESGITVTDIWEDEVTAKAFYDGVAAVSGMQLPPISFSLVYENNFK
jgi:hypothetical protein